MNIVTACLSHWGLCNMGTVHQVAINNPPLFSIAPEDAKTKIKRLEDYVSSRGPFFKGDVFCLVRGGR